MKEVRVLLNGDPLQPHDLYSWSQSALDPRARLSVEITPEARGRIDEAAAFVTRLIKERGRVYGVNTGFGHFAEQAVPADKLEGLQLNLIRSHACGVGEDLPRDLVCAMWLLRLNTFCKGRSGIRLKQVDRIVTLLNAGILGCVPSRGSVGASGDLAPSAHAALVLLGEGNCTRPANDGSGFEQVAAAQALSELGLPPAHLAPKEGLALINGTQLTTAMAIKAWAQTREIYRMANLSAAMTMEAVGGAFSVLDERVLKTHHPATVRAGLEIGGWLEGSSHLNAAATEGRFIQAPYCIRCAPQVHGVALLELEQAEEILQAESEVISDNPLLFPESNEVYSCGNFHAIYPARVSDRLTSALATLSSIAERRINLCMDEKMTGLPRFLTDDGGFNSGMMMLQVTAAALVSECKTLSMPASVDSIPTNCDREDHVSMGPIAGHKALKVIELARTVVAIELMVAAQALELRNHRHQPAGIGRIHDRIREFVPFLNEDRIMSGDIAKMVALIKGGGLLTDERQDFSTTDIPRAERERARLRLVGH